MKLRHRNFPAFASLIAAIILLTSLLAGSLTLVSGQKANTTTPPVRKLEGHPFEPTEELVYVAEFSRALLKKVDIADFRFTAAKQAPAEKIRPASFDQQ